MRKGTFEKAVSIYNERLKLYLVKKGTEPAVADEAIQNACSDLIVSRGYLALKRDVVDGQAYAFLKRCTVNALNKLKRRADLEAEYFVEAVPKDELHSHDPLKDELECPYCFGGDLNHYKACSLCHTIIGQGKTMRSNMQMDEEGLFDCPNLDLHIDVQRALDTLTPLERRLILSQVNGTDTLDGIANVEGVSERSMWRVYAAAKGKLRNCLHEYEETLC